MARVLCVWELGTDLGHLSTLRLPVEIALAQGHTVVMALKEGHNVHHVFGDAPIEYLQAPVRQRPVAASALPIPSFSHLLIRQCFDNVQELVAYISAWRNLFDAVQPDLVLFEHSPVALIAAYGFRFKKVVVGNGFTAPPGQHRAGDPFLPFPTTTPRSDIWQGLLRDDAEVLKLINAARMALALPELPQLHAIYGQADASFLMTWPLLDPYAPRHDATYLGMESPISYAPPPWPESGGPKVFAYLHAIPALLPLLQALQACQAAAVLFIRHLPSSVRGAFEGGGLHFVDAPVDLHRVASDADWVINHGNHSTAAHFAAQGVPQLLIPLHQEQLFLANNLVRQGGALMAYKDQLDFASPMESLSQDGRFRKNAALLAQQCDQYHAVAGRAFLERTIRRLTDKSL